MKILEKQIWHLISLIILLTGVILYCQYDKNMQLGSYLGVQTKIWLIIAVATPIVHQIYVLICWRLELHYNLLTKKLGRQAFNIYMTAFFIFFAGRMVFIILLSISNKDTLILNPYIKYSLSAIATMIGGYAFYSVKRYFGMRRAAGLDHFDLSIRKLAFVKKGIFKYTNNGMYLFAFLILYLPALLWQSRAALVVAIFSHLYIWVHYYFTEKPDIKRIYKQ